METSDKIAEERSRPTDGKLSLPFAFAKRHGVLVEKTNDDCASVIYREGSSYLSLTEVRRYAKGPVHFSIVDPDTFDARLQAAYESGATRTMMEGIDDETDLFEVAQQLPEPSDLLESEDEAPIIRLINAVLTEAVKKNASDIHIEPYETRLVLRFRIDGALQEVLQSRRAVAPLVVSRIKVMSKLDIAEKRLPQDGRMSLRVAGRAVDVRVSTIPSGHGERVVLRLLDKQAGRLDLEHLGMSENNQRVMDKLVHRPHGILLVTGPTGSGKTTVSRLITRLYENYSGNITLDHNEITDYNLTFLRNQLAIVTQDVELFSHTINFNICMGNKKITEN